MITSTVSTISVLSNGCRLDSSYHLSTGNSARRYISRTPYKISSISEFTKNIFYGNRAKRTYVDNREYGTPFLSSSDILQADLDNVKFASNKYTPNIEDLRLHYGWTLITRSGTVGKTTWSTMLHEGKLSSDHVIRVVPNDRIKAGCLYAYLASKYGYALLTQGMFGAVIQSIEPKYIEELPIPVFPISFQEEIDALISDYSKQREDAANALKSAIAIFEEEIGISKLSLRHQVKSISSKKISGKFVRFDAQYQIGHYALSNEKQKQKSIKIGSIAKKILVGNRGKREYVESNGIPFLSSSEMMLANPLKQCKMIRKQSQNIENLKVSKGDILISRSGTVGNTVIVSDTLHGVAVSEHAMKLTIDPAKIEPEYVYAYLLTSQGKSSLEILPYGSVIITLGEDFLADVDLPIINPSKKQEVVTLVRQYCQGYDESIKKENLAVELMEKEIEKWNK